MAKTYLIAVFIFISSFVHAQDYFIFSAGEVDFLEISPAYIQQNKIQKIIEREYLRSNFNKLHLITSTFYNDSGLLTKKINGLAYSTAEPNEQSSFSFVNYKYEIIDSFLYQIESITINKYLNGKIESTEELSENLRNCYNKYKKPIQTMHNTTMSEFLYNEEGNLIKIAKRYPMEQDIELSYDDKQLKKVQSRYSKERSIPFLTDKQVVFVYDLKNRIIEAKTISNNERQNMHEKFYYNDSNQLIKKEIYFNNSLTGIYTYEYVAM